MARAVGIDRKTVQYILIGVFVVGVVYLLLNGVKEGFADKVESVNTAFTNSIRVPTPKDASGNNIYTKLKEIKIYGYNPETKEFSLLADPKSIGTNKHSSDIVYQIDATTGGNQYFYSDSFVKTTSSGVKTNVTKSQLPITLSSGRLINDYTNVRGIKINYLTKNNSIKVMGKEPGFDNNTKSNLRIDFIFE